MGAALESGRSGRSGARCARLPFWSLAAVTAAGSGLRGKGGASQVAEILSRGLEGRGKAGSGWRGEVGGGESLELGRIMWSEKGHRWAWGQKVNPRWEKEKGLALVSTPLGKRKGKMMNGWRERGVGKCE